MKYMISWKNIFFVGLVLVAVVVSRYLPHLPNMSMVTALGIFAASVMPWRKALALVLAVRLVSDYFIGFFSWPLLVAVYSSHAFGVLLGWGLGKVKSDKLKWLGIGTAGLLSAAVFFFVTNFAFLYSMYPNTWEGIFASYVNALPFLKGTLVGDVGYTVLFFGAYELFSYFLSHKFGEKGKWLKLSA